MARHDIRGIIGGGAAPGGAQEKVVQAFREARARAGREGALGAGLCIGFSFHIADSVDQGIKEATPFFEENIKMFAPLGFVPGLTPEQIEAVADPKLPTWGRADDPVAVRGVRRPVAGFRWCGPRMAHNRIRSRPVFPSMMIWNQTTSSAFRYRPR
jgi:hypothetical protein